MNNRVKNHLRRILVNAGLLRKNNVNTIDMAFVNRCSICNGEVYLAEKMLDNDNKEAFIYQCCDCGVLINSTILNSEIENEKSQSDFLEEIYSAEAWSEKELQNNLDTYSKMLKHLFLISDLTNFGKFVDVGSGSGFAAAAATRKFKEVYATDFRIDIVESNLKLLNVNGVLLERTLLPKVEEVDCFFLWHVMEHLKDPLTVLKEMASQLAEEGCVIFQVPLFRKENTFDQHFHFYSANTIRVLAKKSGLIFHKLEFDLDLAYMTCVLKK